MKILRRILIVLGVILLILIILPYLIPLPTIGADPTTLAAAQDGDFVEVDGLLTYYIERGEPDAPMVLLLHGFGGSTFSWRENIDAIVDAGYHVIAFDRPPYGLTEKSADYDYSRAAQTDFTVRFMDALAIESAILVGHSAGSTVIADMAIRYPERVDALIFVSGAVGTMSGDTSFVSTILSIPPVARWAQIIARQVVNPEYFSTLLQGAYYDPEFMTPEIAAGYQVPLQVENWDVGFLALLTRSGGSSLDAELLRDTTFPTLLIWGQEDTWVELSVGERLHDLITRSTLITYPQVGHLPMEENVEQFNRDLIAFLRTIN